MFLTVEDGVILGPICWLFGNIFELMYKLLEIISRADYVNLSVCVILFTFFIRACMFPLNFKQQKSSKIMNFIQPEINKATKKYNNKTDQESLMKKNQETQKIQKKYGVSVTSGCLPALIQLPVFYGLYRVIQNIPAYVGDIKEKYEVIVSSIISNSSNVDASVLKDLGLESGANYYDIINAVATDSDGKVSTAVTAAKNMMDAASDGTVSNDKVIDVLDKISSSDWDQIANIFNLSGDAGKYVDDIQNMNQFLFGLNIADAPGMKLSIALIVPIVSALLQFVVSKISMSSSNTNTNPNDSTAAQTKSMMNMMTYGMPLMSLFFCISLPIAIGLYWIVGSVISIITQLIINRYYKNCDVDEVLEKCKEKAAKKQAKKDAKHPGKKSWYEKMMDAQNGNVSADENQSQNINKMASSRLKSYTNPTVSEVKQTENNVHYKEGSIGSKANIMLKYQNQNNDKGGKK